MVYNTLAKNFADRFCQEHPMQNKIKRELWFKIGNVTCADGEAMFGPSETWPAQMDNFAYLSSRQHSHRKIDYDTLKNIILLEKPALHKNGYQSLWEYAYTVESVFTAIMTGMVHGKINRIIQRRSDKVIRSQSLIDKLLKNNRDVQVIVAKDKLVTDRIAGLKKMAPEYLDITHQFDYALS